MKIFILLISILLSLTSTTTTAAPQTSGSCRCGVSKSTSKSSRIVGGREANKNEFPWQVLLITPNGDYRCGGSLLSSTTVLTAAHCENSRYAVVVGEHDLTKSDGEVKISIADWLNHHDFNSTAKSNDFAIVTLATPVTFSDTVYPICLPTGSPSSYEDKTATVTGWGFLKAGGPNSNTLQKVDVITMSNSDCTNTVYNSSAITSNMICARDSGKDACDNDSGGPLMIKKCGANYFEVAGVVSFGPTECATYNEPGVYARVTSQLDWIKKEITGTTCPTP